MAEKKDAGRKNAPLLLLMLALTPLYGGYHNFSVFLAGLAIVPLLYAAWRRGGMVLPCGVEAWCLYGIWACMVLTVPFAVSPGMAFAGSLRAAVWALFFLLAATYSPQERRDILDAAAYEGALLSLLSIVDFYYSGFHDVSNPNGRIDGFFQYANSWALYLLCCLIILLLREKRKRMDWPAMAALLAGIFLTGSRGTFLVLFFLALVYGVGRLIRQRSAVPLLATVGAVGLTAVLTALFSGGMVSQRLQAITLSSATLNGRLLYWTDGLRMLAAHPMGVGRGGYLYIQALEQLGTYTTHHIHNEYLQAALDGGLLCGILTAALAAALIFRRGAELRERAVCFAVCAHAFIDFDFQFTAIVFLLLLCGTGGQFCTVPVRWVPLAVGCGLLSVLFAYFSVAYYCDFIGKPAAAYAMFPSDLALAEERLLAFHTVEEAEPLADRILADSDLSLLAWDCKYTAAAQRKDWPAMVETKYRYLLLSRYHGSVYKEFADLLEEACLNSSSAEISTYLHYARNILGQLEEVTEQTNPFAYRISDQAIAFAAEMQERMQTLLSREK